MKKRWVKPAIRILAAGAILVITVFCLLLTPPVKRFAFDYLCGRLDKAIGIRVSADSVRLSYFKGSADIENLTISAAAAPDLPPVFRAAKAFIDLDISKALRGKIVIEEIKLIRPEINYFTDSDGNDNIPVLPPSSDDGTAPEILILSAGIHDSVFLYDNRLINLFITIPGWNLDVSGDAQTFTHNLVFENQTDAELRYEDITLPMETLQLFGKLDLNENSLEVSSARVAAAGFLLDMAGSVNFSDELFIDVRVNASGNLQQASALASMEEPLLGKLSGEIRANGDFNRLDVSARLGISDFSFHFYNQPALELALQGNWQSGSGRLIFPEITVSSPEGTVTAKGDLAAPGTYGGNSISAEVKNLNLRPLIKLSDAPLDIASRAGGTLSLEWEGDFSFDKAAASARITLAADLAEPEADILPLSGSLDARLKNNRFEIAVTKLRALDIETAGRLTLTNYKDIDGDFTGTNTGIEATIQQIARLLNIDEIPPVVSELSGPAGFHIKAAGNLDQPELSASLEIPELSFRNLKTAIRSDLFFQGDTLDFTGDFGLPHNSAAALKGSLNFSGDDPVISLKAQAEGVPAEIIKEILDSQIPLSGVVDINADIGGSTRNPEGNAVISISDIFLYEKPLGRLDTELVFANWEIQLEKFLLRLYPENMEFSENMLEARLFYELESGRLGLRANGRDMMLSGWNFHENFPIPEKINLQVSGEGTIDQHNIQARIDADDLKIKYAGKETSLGPVSINADIDSRDARIKVTAPRLNLSADASAGLLAPYPFSGELRAENLDISIFDLKTDDDVPPLGGAVSAVIRAAGDMENPEQTEINAYIQSLALEASDREARLFSPARLRYHAGVLEIPNPALIVTRRSQLEITGRVPIAETISEETLKLNGRVDLAEALSFALMPQGFDIEGVLNFDVGVTVLNGVFGGEGEITMERGLVKIPDMPLPFEAINIKANVEDGALILRDASANWGGGKIAVSGELPFRALPWTVPGLKARDGQVQFKLAVNGLTTKMLDIFPSGMKGNVSFRAEGSADKAELESLRAEIVFDELSFRIETLDFYQLMPTRIEVGGGTATISQLAVIGPETNLRMSGAVGLLSAEDSLDLRLEGFLDAAILTFGDPDIKAAGRFDVRIDAGGTLSKPVLSGFAETENGKFSFRNPRIIADDLHIRLALTPEIISVDRFSGMLNGGRLSGEGSLGNSSGLLDNINLRLSFNNCFLEAPTGLKSLSSGNITITSSEGDAIVIGGNIRIEESIYRESLEIGGQVMNYLKSQQVVVLSDDPTQDSILNRLRFNVSARTMTPLLVQNNVARVEAEASGLRLVGTYMEPSITGRVTLAEGGKIILNQREYYLDRGAVTFVSQTRVEPDIDIQAHTEVAGYNITLRLNGSPDRITTVLSSEPSLSERDILSLLLTGQTSAETQGREIQVMQTQALYLLAGQAGEMLTGEARRALGLSTFRIDPDFITSESEPGARLTIGEDITRDFSLAYSMNLTNGGDQIWAAQYAITRRLNTQATRQKDESYRFEFRHDIPFGNVNTGRPAARQGRPESAEERTRQSAASGNTKFEIGNIDFTGVENSSKKTLMGRLAAKPGSRYDFSKIQKGIDRMQDFYIRDNYLEADIRMKRETRDDKVDIELNITPGPKVRFNFEGFNVSSNSRRNVERTWTDGAFERARIEDSLAVLRRDMMARGYLQAEISAEAEIIAQDDSQTEVRQVVFYIAPGILYSGVGVRFSGAVEIGSAELRQVIKKAGLELDVYTNPEKAAEYIQRYYRERGYLSAMAVVRLDLDPETSSGEAVIEIREGPLFTIGELEFTGNSAFSYTRLWMVIPTSSGSFYSPDNLRNSLRAIENLYHSNGYNDVSASFRVVQDTPNALAHLTFQITERRQSFIEEIEIEGNQRNSLSFVTSQLDFQTGDALNFEKINESRRRLYGTGTYASVDFQTDEIAAGNGNADPSRKNMRVRLRLRENAPYRMQYGLYYDTDRGPGGIFEVKNTNVLGRASSLGFRFRYDSELKEGRVYYNQPFIRSLHLRMDAGAFMNTEHRPAYCSQRTGFSLTQERTLPRAYRIDYGYRYDYVSWELKPQNDYECRAEGNTAFQENVTVARLAATVMRDTRDNALDATRGEFASHTLEFGPTWLGSETGFARYYGQYFRYVALDKYLKLKTEDQEGNRLPARFVYAGALRLGLASTFGNRERPSLEISPEHFFTGGRELIYPERFFAGGGTTLRGFEQDMLGAEMTQDGSWRARGGEGLFLFNNEIRFPIWSILHGVGFLDIGNVYERLSDFNFSIRKSAGAGLRLKIKFVPLRFDYGFKLDRRPGESAGAFFFSIGQAF